MSEANSSLAPTSVDASPSRVAVIHGLPKSPPAREADERLEDEFGRGPRSRDDEPSNYAAMCEAAFRERQFSRPCSVCNGTGARDIGVRRLESYRRRLRGAGNEGDRRNIRIKQAQESHCHVCDGTGFKTATERGRNLQRTWCEDCYGTGDSRSGESCKRCRGLGHLCLGEADSMFTLARCPRCRGSAEVPDEDAQDECPVCRGEGATIPITVRGKGSSRHGFGPDVGAAQADQRNASGSVYEPDHLLPPDEEHGENHDEGIAHAFQSLARTRRRLARVLANFHGALGNRWGHGHPWGRYFVVWPDTEAGRSLMAAAPEKMRRELGARPIELLARIRDEEERAHVPTMRTRALITHADRQAKRLVEEAKSALAEALVR